LTKGEKPGKGVYRCTYCWYDIEIKDDDHELPMCPVCGGVRFF
jgi:DNA-directed RNA polymerase subunit RPC12/RpoP